MFCTSINIDNLDYRSPTNNKNGGKVVVVSTMQGSTDWKDRIRFQMSEDEQTNRQTAVWGLGSPLPGQDASRRTLELTIESPTLLDFLTRLDEHNVSVAHKMSENWFKKQLDMEQIRNMYVSLVKAPMKEGLKHTVRVKVKCGEYPTNIYAASSSDTVLTYNKTTHNDLSKNVKCMVIAETVGLWFMSRQFGMSLTATDIVVWPDKRASGIQAFSFSQKITVKEDPNEPESVDMSF